MFVRKLQIQNLHSHVDTILELERLTVVRGANAVGKSSIEHALQIALAGRTDSTTADGKGSAGLVRAGAQKALITLAVRQAHPANEDPNDGERILKCAISSASKRTLLVTRPGDATYSGGEEWREWLESHRETLSCLINNRYFVDLKPDAQADLLAAIVLPKTCEWPEWVRKAAFDCELSINWARTPFEILAQGYDLAYKERTGINRDLKNFVMPEGDTSPAQHLETVSHKVGELRTELEELKKRKYDAAGEARARQQLIASVGKRLSEAQARLSREEQEVTAVEADLLSDAKLKDHQKAAKLLAKAEKEDKEIARLVAEHDVAVQALRKFNELTQQPECPTCSTVLTADVVARIAAPLIKQKDALAADLDGARDRRRALGNPAESQKLLEAHTRAVADMERARQRANDERTAVRDAQAKIDELRSQPDADTSSFDATIADLESRMAVGEAKVAEARRAKELIVRIAAAREQHAKLVSRQQQVEKLVEYFGTEARTKLLAESVGAFTESMNMVLGHWGYECTLSVDPYVLAIRFRNEAEGTVEIPLAHLSKSQRYRFAIAFQVALAITTGFRFVVVDEADIFDPRSRAGLFAALNGGLLDQAIVLGTDQREDVPDVPGTAFYMLENTALPGMIPTTHARALKPAAKLEPAVA